jgi:hypothetical protein
MGKKGSVRSYAWLENLQADWVFTDFTGGRGDAAHDDLGASA